MMHCHWHAVFLLNFFIWLLLQIILSGANEIFCDRYHRGQLPGHGHIAHFNYPFNYTENQFCAQYIYIPPTHFDNHWQICFTFRRFHLETLSEPGFGDYLEFPGQLRYCGNGSTAINFSSAPPSLVPLSDPRANIFFKNICFPLEQSTKTTVFTIRFNSLKKPSRVNGYWLGYYADYEIKSGHVTSHEPPTCQGSRCARYCYHGFKFQLPDGSCNSSCTCSDEAVSAPCNDDQFTCFNRQCVPKNVTCDGYNDCSDASDESQYHAQCPGFSSIDACSFEDDSCNFQGILWNRTKSSSPEPSSDNTLKTLHGGNYMLAQYPKFDRAHLNYTATPINRFSNHCLSFWYYFSGGPAGSLLVYIETADDEVPSLVWRRDYVPSSSRLSWHPGTVSLPVNVFPIKLLWFEARHGELASNFIAIDDVSLLSGDCSEDDVSCSFELDSCGWTSRSSWRREHRKMGSMDHMPLNQNYSNNYYMGCQVQTMINDNTFMAELASPTINPTLSGLYCFSFDYFVHCGVADNMTVHIRFVDDSTRQLWSMSCVLVTEWQHADVQLDLQSNRTPFQILFITSLGRYESIHVHFGVDDIVLMPGLCLPRQQPSVTFMPAPATHFSRWGDCPKGEYKCKDGWCIDAKLMCNSQYDCRDKSDEGPGCSPQTGGELIKAVESANPMVASAVGITLGIVIGIAAMVISIYCVVRQRLRRRSRRLNGGSAADYLDGSDFAGPRSLLPPAYTTAVLMGPEGLPTPPPYQDDRKLDEAPPEYELYALTSCEGTDEDTKQTEDSSV